MDMFVFTGIIWKEEGGFTSLCPELDVVSQGDSLEQAKQMLLEAATLHLEGAFEDGLLKRSVVCFAICCQFHIQMTHAIRC